MLKYIIESFSAAPEHIDTLRFMIFDYHAFMISEGFLGRTDHMRVESEENGRLSAGGVLTHGDFPPKGLELEDCSKKVCDRLLAKRNDILSIATELDLQVLNLSDSQDSYYCNHNRWSGLVLAAEADWLLGISPMLCCDCGGHVAPYRVPHGDRIGEAVWSFSAQSDCVEACWSASGVLEAWANGERHDPLSRLNALGLSIVNDMQSKLGIETWLYIPARNSTTATTCPLCEDEMAHLDSRFFWNYACHDCRIVTGLDITP